MTIQTATRAQQVAALAATAAAARERLGAFGVSVTLAGIRVDIEFAGRLLFEGMTPAFGHVLALSGTPAQLRVEVWGQALSGIPLPDAVQPISAHAAQSMGRVRAEEDVLSYYDFESGALSYLDLDSGQGFLCVEDGRSLAERHRAAPLQTILTWFLPRQSRYLLHAAAVGTEVGAVLLCGPGGAGKSTTALSCLAEGFTYISDDLCAVTTDDPITVHSLFSTAKLHAHHLPHFPDFAKLVTNSERLATEKGIAYLTQDPRASLARSLPLRAAIVVASKIDGLPALRQVAPARALRAIAPGTQYDFPGFGREGFAGQAEVLARVPCFEIDLSRDFRANARCLRDLLERLPGRDSGPEGDGR